MTLRPPPIPLALRKHALQHETMQQAIRNSLPSELAPHVTLLNLRSGTLILASDEQALITALRFCAPQVLHAVNALLPEPSAQRVAWRTLQRSGNVPRPTRHAPSSICGELMHSMAGEIEDTRLRSAVQKLAATLHRKAKK